MTNARTRLDRLALLAKPARCRWEGQRCRKTELVGDGTLDPKMPEFPATCAACGRPISRQVVVVCGVDVSRI